MLGSIFRKIDCRFVQNAYNALSIQTIIPIRFGQGTSCN